MTGEERAIYPSRNLPFVLQGKSWEQHVNEETGDARPDQGYVHGTPQADEHIHINYSKAEEIALIAKIVRDLRDIRIGDSPYVLPPSLLEKQVKCNDDAPLTNPTTDVVETQLTTRGQGDTHQIVHAEVFESPAESTEPVRLIRRKKESEAANEATNVSVGLIHQLIEDLEDKTIPVCSEDNTPSDSVSKEHIATWEEKEEQFVRTIESNAGGRHDTTTSILRDSKSIGRFRVIELKHDEELKSHSSQHVGSSREVDLEEVQLEKRGANSLSSLKPSRDEDTRTVDQILPIDDAEKRKTFGEATAKKKKKKGFGSRLRKLFRAAFGRRRKN
ncbi:uncharacterized protein LOC105835908 isoform X2 [Monomorium pharaonis]|uniref:uncharacterized protein LOC105835908 isoform X2 n=1 Tax=Monomorium pharaonis TaxID=307658 RepID=UPI001747C20D|nr:uncharacterized protein LOC105835908 isoform X2 [Monomorium pharaonis]